MKSLLLAGIATVSLAFTSPAHSTALLTSAIGYTGPAFTIPSFYGDPNNFLYFNGPLSIGNGVTISSNAPSQSDIGVISYSLADNGELVSSPFIGLDDDTSTMTLTFATPIKSFGLGINYAIGTSEFLTNNPVISAFDSNNVLIASYNLEALAPIRTPGGIDQFQFRGITSTGEAISSFQLSGAFIVGQAQLATSVPEPATWILMLVGLGATTLVLRRQRHSERA